MITYFILVKEANRLTCFKMCLLKVEPLKFNRIPLVFMYLLILPQLTLMYKSEVMFNI